jgi:hypothetical protein
MVEGFRTQTYETVGNGIRVIQHVRRNHAKNIHALALQPFGPCFIALRAVTEIMSRTIDFDRELYGRTVEIENVRAERVLPAEPDFGVA